MKKLLAVLMALSLVIFTGCSGKTEKDKDKKPAADKGADKAADKDKTKATYTNEYREKFANPYAAAALGYIDEVIRPRETRAKLAAALRMLRNKRQSNPPKKHGNLPL